LITTSRWWRKHGTTADATVVEVGVPRQSQEAGLVNQEVTAEFTDPATGQVLRMKSTLWTNCIRRAGEPIKVRWSPQRDYFEPYDQNTVPEEEWLREMNAPPAELSAVPGGAPASLGGGVQIVNASGADPATVLAKVGKLHDQGLVSDQQWAQIQQQLGGVSAAGSVGASPAPESVERRLSDLEALKRDGAIDAQEYAAQRRRILESM
jgi:hypothetical protein